MQLYLRPNARQLQSWDKNSKSKTSKAEHCFFKLERKMTRLRPAEVIPGDRKINFASNLNTAIGHLQAPIGRH